MLGRGVRVGVGVRVDVGVAVGVRVKVGLGVKVAVGGLPTTVKEPERIHWLPTKHCT